MGTSINGIYLPSIAENGWGEEVNDNFRRFGEAHMNVKAYGAVGDGVTNDTAAIQAAVNAAGAVGGTVYVPPGEYLVTSTIAIPTATVSPIIIRGAGGYNNVGHRSLITGNIAGAAIISRAATTSVGGPIIEDLAIKNLSATGQGIAFDGAFAPCGVYRCYVAAYRGILGLNNTFGFTIVGCRLDSFALGSASGGIGIFVVGHSACINNDVSGWHQGYRTAGPGVAIVGGRTEVCTTGIMLGMLLDGSNTNATRTSVSGHSMEANDTGIVLNATSGGCSLSGIGIHGSVNAPSGQSLVGISVTGAAYGSVISGVNESGSHSTAFMNITGTPQSLTLSSVHSSSAWVLPANLTGLEITNCIPAVNNVHHLPVVATASLPAASTNQNGRAIIEDNGAGDRNLIIYAGGQRFRIDGGAAI